MLEAVVYLIEAMDPSTWEEWWPAIKQALTGLGAGALAVAAGKAASKGLTDLAQKISSFQPVATPDDPSLPVPSLSLPGIDSWQPGSVASLNGRANSFPPLSLPEMQRIASNELSSVPPLGDPDRCRWLRQRYELWGMFFQDIYNADIGGGVREFASRHINELGKKIDEEGCNDDMWRWGQQMFPT